VSALPRRSLLVHGALLGLLPLAACKKGPVTCPPATLDPGDAQQRAALKYVDAAPSAEKACQHCQQYVMDANGGCGSCKLLKGAINPDGTCMVFAAKS
jgi:hypothetical protein